MTSLISRQYQIHGLLRTTHQSLYHSIHTSTHHLTIVYLSAMSLSNHQLLIEVSKDLAHSGPILFLPLFSVSVTPSRITVEASDDVMISCTSNVSEVTNLTWTNIPSAAWRYQAKKDLHGSSELTIIDIGTELT